MDFSRTGAHKGHKHYKKNGQSKSSQAYSKPHSKSYSQSSQSNSKPYSKSYSQSSLQRTFTVKLLPMPGTQKE